MRFYDILAPQKSEHLAIGGLEMGIEIEILRFDFLPRETRIIVVRRGYVLR